MAAPAITFLSCISMGWPIHGGIDLSLAMDIDDNELYGPAIARAYTIESKIAFYPRIVIGDELIRYLNAITSNQTKTAGEIAHAKFAATALNFLAQDDDGNAFLDYLGDDIRNTLSDQATLKVVKTAHEFVIKKSIEYKECRNSKLGFRYTLLRNYFESRLPRWGPSILSG